MCYQYECIFIFHFMPVIVHFAFYCKFVLIQHLLLPYKIDHLVLDLKHALVFSVVAVEPCVGAL